MLFSLFQNLTPLNTNLKAKTETLCNTDDAFPEDCDETQDTADSDPDPDPDPKPENDDSYLCFNFGFKSEKYFSSHASYNFLSKKYESYLNDKTTPPPECLFFI